MIQKFEKNLNFVSFSLFQLSVVDHGQCNTVTLKWHRQPLLAPHPLKSSNSSKCDYEKRRNEVWIRHCPQLGLFQVVREPVEYRQDLPGDLDLKLEADMRLYEFPPIGGLIFTRFIFIHWKVISKVYFRTSLLINKHHRRTPMTLALNNLDKMIDYSCNIVACLNVL